MWNLSFGCHAGTITSRDSARKTLDSLQECYEFMIQAEEDWKRIGYRVWYATAYGPNKEVVVVCAENTSYTR